MSSSIRFPIWQIDKHEYSNICSYLDLTPDVEIYRKLDSYLRSAPFNSPCPKGFSYFLSTLRLSKFNVARLDLISKLILHDLPIRTVINAVIALHECDKNGYKELASPIKSSGLISAVANWSFVFLLSLILTSLWTLGRGIQYFVFTPFVKENSLSKKKVLITGISRGLGNDLMLDALQQGAEVVGTVRTQQALDSLLKALPKEAPISVIIADSLNRGSLRTALDNNKIDLNSIDIAIMCAATKHTENLASATNLLRDTFEVNFFSISEFAMEFVHTKRENVLVLISSIGRWHGMHSSCGYNASKAALSIWGESLEMDLLASGNKNTRVMIVEPGLFQSGMIENKGLKAILSTSRNKLSGRILLAALNRKRTLYYPFWFSLLTWGLCVTGRRFRNRFFIRAIVKEGS